MWISGHLWSGRRAAEVTVAYELARGNCNYRHLNMSVGISSGGDNEHLKNVNMFFSMSQSA